MFYDRSKLSLEVTLKMAMIVQYAQYHNLSTISSVQ